MSAPGSAQPIAVTVKSRADLDKSSEANVEIVILTQGGRLFRAMKGLGICWAIAVFCVLIPILHFILVPLFLLIGIVMFLQQFGQKFYFASGSVRCPSCQTDMKPREGAFDWPKEEICGNCRAILKIYRKN